MDLSVFKRCFTSFQDLQHEINEFCKKNHVHLIKRDSKALEKSFNRSKVARNANPELKYYTVNYTCFKGRRNFIPRPDYPYKRKPAKSQKIDCPFCLHFLLSPDGQSLKLTKYNNEHNHTLSKEELDLYTRLKKRPIRKKKQFQYLEKPLSTNISPEVLAKRYQPIRKKAEFQYLVKPFYIEQDSNNISPEPSIIIDNSIPPEVQAERYCLAAVVTSKLAELASEAPDSIFEERMNVLQEIISYWKDNKEINVQTVPTVLSADTLQQEILKCASYLQSIGTAKVVKHEET